MQSVFLVLVSWGVLGHQVVGGHLCLRRVLCSCGWVVFFFCLLHSTAAVDQTHYLLQSYLNNTAADRFYAQLQHTGLT